MVTCGLQLPQEIQSVCGFCLLAVDHEGHHEADEQDYGEVAVPQGLAAMPDEEEEVQGADGG